jgi:hypothetical protein
MNDKCEGCKDARPTVICFIRAHGTKEHVETCPCKPCLVKAMCSLACDEYEHLSNMVEVKLSN